MDDDLGDPLRAHHRTVKNFATTYPGSQRKQDTTESTPFAAVSLRSTARAYPTNLLSTQTAQELLYVTLSVVLGSSLLTLIAIMFVCACRQRRRQRILGY